MDEGENLHRPGQQGIEIGEVEQPLGKVTGTNRKLAPRRLASNCHGTRLLWCSISVSKMTSPSPTFASPRCRGRRG